MGIFTRLETFWEDLLQRLQVMLDRGESILKLPNPPELSIQEDHIDVSQSEFYGDVEMVIEKIHTDWFHITLLAPSVLTKGRREPHAPSELGIGGFDAMFFYIYNNDDIPTKFVGAMDYDTMLDLKVALHKRTQINAKLDKLFEQRRQLAFGPTQ